MEYQKRRHQENPELQLEYCKKGYITKKLYVKIRI